MTLKEFYIECNGDYDAALSRFMDEARISKFLNLFLKDDSYSSLLLAIDEKRWKDAFRYSHNLKGVSANLSLNGLFTPASELCEYLRNLETEPGDEMMGMLDKVKEQYQKVSSLIGEIQL